mgnify:FL=1
MKILLHDDRTILFQFPFNPVLTRQVKQLPNPQWQPPLAGWGVPYSPLAAYLTHKYFPQQEVYESETHARLAPPQRPAPTTFPDSLFDFQRDGAHFLATKTGTIANDCPGSGKTRQALAAAESPTLVICPASVVYHWREELKALYPHRQAGIVRGRRGELPNHNDLICSPGLLPARCRDLLLRTWGTIIVDEIHEYRNPDALRTKALLAISTRCPQVLGVTGTLIVNRIADLFAPLAIIKQLRPKDRHWFEVRYCGKTQPRVKTAWRQTPDGFTHEEELRSYLKTCVLHRTRADLQRFLPPLHRQAVTVPLANQSEYAQTVSTTTEWLRLCGTAAPPETKMIKLNKLRRLGAIGKVPAVIDVAKHLVAAGEHVVIACSFLTPLRQLEAALPHTIRLDGGVPKARRQALVTYFQQSMQPQVALCSILAAGVGITLTRARYVLILDLPWSPIYLEQLEARIHRETQTRECYSYYFLGQDTTDPQMLAVLRKKARWANRLFEGGDAVFIDPLAVLVDQLTSANPTTHTPLVTTAPAVDLTTGSTMAA